MFQPLAILWRQMGIHHVVIVGQLAARELAAPLSVGPAVKEFRAAQKEENKELILTKNQIESIEKKLVKSRNYKAAEDFIRDLEKDSKAAIKLTKSQINSIEKKIEESKKYKGGEYYLGKLKKKPRNAGAKKQKELDKLSMPKKKKQRKKSGITIKEKWQK